MLLSIVTKVLLGSTHYNQTKMETRRETAAAVPSILTVLLLRSVASLLTQMLLRQLFRQLLHQKVTRVPAGTLRISLPCGSFPKMSVAAVCSSCNASLAIAVIIAAVSCRIAAITGNCHFWQVSCGAATCRRHLQHSRRISCLCSGCLLCR